MNDLPLQDTSLNGNISLCFFLTLKGSHCILTPSAGEDDYVVDVEASDDIQKVVSRINECLSSNAKLCRDFMVQFGRRSPGVDLHTEKRSPCAS